MVANHTTPRGLAPVEAALVTAAEALGRAAGAERRDEVARHVYLAGHALQAAIAILRGARPYARPVARRGRPRLTLVRGGAA
jgi:hypothetical protein